MASLCEAGLFVGVNGYPGLPEESRLKHTEEDARWLAGYFSKAWAERAEHWVHLPDAGRLAILKGVADLIGRVGPGGTGVFHFAGHSAHYPDGLVLAPSDFDPAFPADSGVPLRRLFDLFKQAAGAGRTFFLVLDSCRVAADPAATADDVPQNVCVLYSCTLGGVTHEGPGGGVLTKAVLAALNDHAREAGEHIPCTPRRLVARLRNRLVSSLTAPTPTYELYGGLADRIHLPLTPRPGGPARATTRPLCSLIADAGKPDLANDLASFILTWFEADDDRDRADALVRKHLKADARKHQLQLRLPDDTHFWEAREFLERLLELFYNDFPTLTFRWRGVVSHEFFMALGGLLPQAYSWERLPSDTFKLTWVNAHRPRAGDERETLGHLFLDHPNRSTEICVKCQPPRLTEFLPLSYLLPSLGDLYERLRFVSPPVTE